MHARQFLKQNGPVLEQKVQLVDVDDKLSAELRFDATKS